VGAPLRWTWVLPRSPARAYSFAGYHRFLLERWQPRVQPEVVFLDATRPVLSKWFSQPRFARLSRQAGPFHVDAVFLPNLAINPLPKLAVTVFDLCPGLRPDLHPMGFVEHVEARLALAGARRADVLLTISAFQADELAAKLPFPRERIFAGNYGVDNDFLQPAPPKERERLRAAWRARLGIAEDEAMVLYVGSWLARKNVPGLLRAMRMLLDRGVRARLLMRPQPEPRWALPVQQAIDALRLAPHLAWLPSLDDRATLRELYQMADVLAFPSFYEGWGLPPHEALACGCPVVCSDATSLPEVVGDAALMVKADDTAALADALQRVLEDEGLARQLAAKGPAQARRHTWDTMVAPHVAAYETMARR
jgi:glycosyltransferase involved in cell wall biosynthesis